MRGKITAALPGLGGEFEGLRMAMIFGEPAAHAGLEFGAALRTVQVRHPDRGLGANCSQLECVRGECHSSGLCSMITSRARAMWRRIVIWETRKCAAISS